MNFEAGAGWVRDIPVIPLYHSGMIPQHLPTPLSELQGAVATRPEDLAKLSTILAKAIGASVPTVDWSSFVEVVKSYEAKYAIESSQIQQLQEGSPVPPQHGLLPYELTALLSIAENADGISAGRAIWQIRNDMEKAGYRKLTANLAITSLMRKDFIVECVIDPDRYSNDPPDAGARLTEAGWEWLQTNAGSMGLLSRIEPDANWGTSVVTNDGVPF